MKKNYFAFALIFSLFIFKNSIAQTTSIPDANLEEALIGLNIDIDSVVNGSIATSEISNITFAP